jgi:ABC-type transport system involved in multi-copper enzyme maturation permease subunit
MVSVAITLSILVSILFFLVGGLIVWVVSQHIADNKLPYMHPEFFDRNGNIIPDEILALRFEGDLNDYYEDEDDSCEE